MRASGILLHISSLPSPYGIGTLGRTAFDFVDFLARAGQSYWQLLPIGPTSVGDSPYQSCSVFAGNPYFIDLDLLVQQGLLQPSEVQGAPWGALAQRVDYALQYRRRYPLLFRACDRGREKYAAEFAAFRQAHPWVADYGLFMALKEKFGQLPWNQWPEKAARREPEALARYGRELKEQIDRYEFLQYLFHGQWQRLHDYARNRGVKIIGDLPIYVPLDSVEVWMYPHLFQLDGSGAPTAVAGCPPDAFSEDGQLWGNPLYDWDEMEKTGYDWWQTRARAAARFFDVIRIDHFRGLESYWAVPYGDDTAKNGRWRKGPGMGLIRALKQACPDTAFIAEDLGFLTPEVLALQEASGFPGMKVLQFAFDGDDNAYLPHRQIPHCVCYTGTHDNETILQWLQNAPQTTVETVTAYLGLNDREGAVRGVLRGGMSTVAELFVSQMQDWLELGQEGRMNTPGTLSEKNWSWRLSALPDKALTAQIAAMTGLYGRLPRREGT